METLNSVNLDDWGFILHVEPKEEYCAGRDVRKLSDTHLINCRRLATSKLKDLEDQLYRMNTRGAYSGIGFLNIKVKFYRKMYELVENEIKRRFMKKDLISISDEIGEEYIKRQNEQYKNYVHTTWEPF